MFENRDSSLIMLSGGINSTVLLAYLRSKNLKNIEGIFFHYYNCSTSEKDSAERVAKYYNINLNVIDISSVYCSMKKPVETASLIRFNNFYIPYRNGVFISTVAAIAYYKNVQNILWGVLGTSSSYYPDNSSVFIEQQAMLVNIGTYKKVDLFVPFFNKSKLDLIQLGKDLGAPLDLTWSCIESDIPCGRCFGCLDRYCAFDRLKSNG